MCSYLVCKFVKREKYFTNIVKLYCMMLQYRVDTYLTYRKKNSTFKSDILAYIQHTLNTKNYNRDV